MKQLFATYTEILLQNVPGQTEENRPVAGHQIGY
jgi:hypothetical protein